jgi:hypothetical protein
VVLVVLVWLHLTVDLVAVAALCLLWQLYIIYQEPMVEVVVTQALFLEQIQKLFLVVEARVLQMVVLQVVLVVQVFMQVVEEVLPILI